MFGVWEGQSWGGVGREETLKWDPHGWTDAGLEQTARELGHVNMHRTSLGVRGAQVRLSKAKASRFLSRWVPVVGLYCLQ